MAGQQNKKSIKQVSNIGVQRKVYSKLLALGLA